MSGKINISIIIPAFNAQHTISEAIESCLRLTKITPKIIVVNDGSSDSTREILNQYKHNDQVAIIDLPKNRGVSNARNTGIDATNSEFILFLDADDYFLANADTTIQDNLIANPSIDLFCFGYIINGYKSPRPKSGRLNMEFLRAKFSNTNTFVVKRTALGNLKFDERYKIGEDTLFWFTLLSSIRAKYFAKEIAHYNYQPKINLATEHPLLSINLSQYGLNEKEQDEVRRMVTSDQNRRAAFSRTIPPLSAFRLMGFKGLAFWLLGPSNFSRAWRINRFFRK